MLIMNNCIVCRFWSSTLPKRGIENTEMTMFFHRYNIQIKVNSFKRGKTSLTK